MLRRKAFFPADDAFFLSWPDVVAGRVAFFLSRKDFFPWREERLMAVRGRQGWRRAPGVEPPGYHRTSLRDAFMRYLVSQHSYVQRTAHCHIGLVYCTFRGC